MEIPDILYKYMSADVIDKGYFKCPTLRFTPWQELNDIMELSPAFEEYNVTIKELEYVIKEIKRYHSSNKCKDEFEKLSKNLKQASTLLSNFSGDNLNRFTKLMIDNNVSSLKGIISHAYSVLNEKFPKAVKKSILNKKIGVLSLSDTEDNLLCWSYYTSNTGFCIGIDSTVTERLDKKFHYKDIKTFRKVKYSNVRSVIRFSREDFLDEFIDMLYTKNNQWCHEKEYRCICKKVDELNDHIWLDGCLKLDPKMHIKSIIVGARMKEEHKEKIYEYASSNEIKLLTIEDNEKDFNLKVVPFNNNVINPKETILKMEKIIAELHYSSKSLECTQLKEQISQIKKG